MASISSLGIGSGLPLNDLLDQLKGAERQKLEPIKRQQASFQAKISAYGKLQGALSSFKGAAAKLNDSALYQSVSSRVSGEGIKAAASGEAQPGRYDVEVTQLARAQSVATQGFAEQDTQLGAGKLTLDVGTGPDAKSVTIDIAAKDSTLAGMRDAINAADAGVTATLVNDGGSEPYRLVLTANDTGTDAALQSMTFQSDAGDAALDNQLSYNVADATASQTVAAKNAQLKVNGIDISSTSNQVEGAIQGVTLTLEEAGTSTVEVERNTLAVREAISGFVKAFNDLKGTMKGLTRFDADNPGGSGALLGDATLRTVESRLRSTLYDSVAGGELSMLSDVGITLQLDGTLKLDEDKMSEVVANQPDALASFLAGDSEEGGFIGRLDATLEQLLSEKGTLDNAKSGLESRISSLDESYVRMEASIESTIDRYRSQFSQLDSMLASMNNTSNYLTQQFDMMNAQLGRKK